MQKPVRDKAIKSPPAEKQVEPQELEFSFSGDGKIPPITIKAASAEEAQAKYEKLLAQAEAQSG
jgi:hypothetical protein